MSYILFGLAVLFGAAYCVSIESKNIEPPRGPLNGPQPGEKHRP